MDVENLKGGKNCLTVGSISSGKKSQIISKEEVGDRGSFPAH